MKVILQAVCLLAMAAVGFYFMPTATQEDNLRVTAQEVQPPSSAQWVAPNTSGSTIMHTSTGSSGLITISTGSSNLTVVTAPPHPQILVSCDESACRARGVDLGMDDAKALLERIASRSTRVEVSVDNRCHVQREVLPPRPELRDLVADARE